MLLLSKPFVKNYNSNKRFTFQDTPGFIVNRLLVPYTIEAMRMVERGMYILPDAVLKIISPKAVSFHFKHWNIQDLINEQKQIYVLLYKEV